MKATCKKILFMLLLAILPLRASMAQIDQSDMATDLAEALTCTKYPSYAQYDSMMHYLAGAYPEICTIDTFGTSAGGRLLLALKISDNPAEEEDEPAFLYTSTMHGDELVGFVLLLRLARFMLEQYGTDPEVDRLVNGMELWINPLANPDGTYANDADTSVARSVRYNLNGRDLNRTFPDAGAGDPDDTTGLQPENRHMMTFMKQHGFNMAANLHSGAEVVNYPWDHKFALHPDDDWYRLISREYADLSHEVDPYYMMGFDNGITNGAEWYVITGGRQDYVNYYLRGREVTLELSGVKKLPSEQLEEHWNLNKWSLVSYMTQALYGIHGKVTGRSSGNPVAAKIWVMDHDNDSSWVWSNSDHGSFYRYLAAGVYDLLISAGGYMPDTVVGVQVLDYQRTELNVALDSLDTGTPHQPFSNVTLFPNPAGERLFLRSERAFGTGTRLEIFTAEGRFVCAHEIPAGVNWHAIDVSHLPGGIYFVRITGRDTIRHGSFVHE